MATALLWMMYLGPSLGEIPSSLGVCPSNSFRQA